MAKIITELKRGNYAVPKICHPSLLNCQSFIDESVLSPSGLSCINHAYAIINILQYLEADDDTLNAAMLYSMVEYGDLPADDLDDVPGSVFDLVHGIQAMGVLHQVYSASSFGDNLSATDAMRRMMLAMVHDGRTVLVKLVEQVVILLHSKDKSQALQDRLANETMMIYAPLANRLGLSELKWQLEDLAFRAQEPEIYKALSKGVSLNRARREELVIRLVQELKDLLYKHNVTVKSCYGRAKHLYSLYKKMQRKDLSLQEIYDAIAIRVLVEEVDDCYEALSAIHETWQVILQEFDDYIAKPKPNGYQSIHTAVMYSDFPVEIQIRTEAMHAAAEVGVAAHWLYKEGASSDVKNKSKWLDQLTTNSAVAVDSQRPNTFEQNAVRLFQDRVFVFTPTGEVKDLPKGATALDFAYAVHSQVGHTCTGVKINGAIVPIKTILKNGDKLEVITKKNSGPSKDWLKLENGFLKTPKARAKVAHWFRLYDQKTNDQGRSMFTKFAKANSLDMSKILPKVLSELALSSDAFYYKIGAGELKLSNLLKSYLPENKNIQELDVAAPTKPSKKHRIEILVDGMSEVKTAIAACCYPLPREEIVGYISSSRGIVVHRSDCQNIETARADKIINVIWAETNNLYEAQLFCSCQEFYLANEALQQVIVKDKVRLTHLNVLNKHSDFTDNVIFEFRILVAGITELELFIKKLKARKSIVNVWR